MARATRVSLVLAASLALFACCQPCAAGSSTPRKLLQLQRPQLAVTGELVQLRQPAKVVAAQLEATADSRFGGDNSRRLQQLQRPQLAVTGELVQLRQPAKVVAAQLEATADSRFGGDNSRRLQQDAASNQFISSTLDKLPTFEPERAMDLTVSGDLVQQRQPAKRVAAQLEATAASRFASLAGARRLQQQPDLSVSGDLVQQREPAKAVLGSVEAAAKARFADSRRSSGVIKPRAAQPAISEISAAVKSRFTDVSESNAQVSNQAMRRLQATQEAVAAKVLTGSKRLGKGAPVRMQQPSN